MLSKKVYIPFLLLIVAIAMMSSVSASELADDGIADDNHDELEIDEKVSEVNSGDLSKTPEVDDEKVLGSSDESVKSKNVKSFSNLQNLIENSFEGATITLNDDYCWDSNYTGSAVFIEKSITINGNGHTIDGDENSRIFIISAKNVVLNNINFINGYGDSSGGGYGGSLYIYGDNELVTINNCNFTNCRASSSGGAIATISHLKINNCYFEDNFASKNGGAIYAFYPLKGPEAVTITDSTFKYNGADSYGGAVYLDAYTSKGLGPLEAGKSYIKNSIFEGNGAIYGGAIFNYQYLDVADSKFDSNYADYGGGAIYMSAGAIFTGKSGVIGYPFGLIIHGTSSFIDNYADRYGGAIRISTSQNHVDNGIKGILRVYDNVLFEKNEASTGGALSLIESDAVVENAIFRNNTANEASAMEGGIAIDCIFEGNTGTATSGVEVITRKATTLSVSQSGSQYNAKTLTVNSNAPNADVVVKFSNGKSVTLKTNANGVAKYNVPYTPGTYSATLTFAGNNYYKPAAAIAKITISKATPKITASKKTFKLKAKSKKYAITLKSNGKAVKGAKVTIKVNGKKYTAKTNAKGKATFKLSKLKKKGTFKSTVSYSGNSCYKACSKKVKITVKK